MGISRGRLAIFGLAAVATLPGGCISASLATSTGPRPPGHTWSVEGRQMVHVGEEVRFDFVLQDWRKRFIDPTGVADYCVVTLEGERHEVGPDLMGHFQFSHLFDRVEPGRDVNVEAIAMRQRGHRDFMRIRGQWEHSDSPYEEADQAIAGDSVRLLVYERPIALRVVRPADDLDPETGVLKIRRDNGPTTSVFIDRPGRPGFTIIGPEPDGFYRITYRPKGSELNPIGVTEVELTIYDMVGQPHYASTTLETP
jgi:hypothetical protein